LKNQEIGAQGEYLARLFLEQKGFHFIRCNYRTKYGEIDLIMQENDEIVFLEVKTRTLKSFQTFGRASEKIDLKKQRNILLSAKVFLREEKNLTQNLVPRFDAVEIYLDKNCERKVKVLHTPCAFGF